LLIEGEIMVAIVTCVVAGFFSAIGWWGANRLVVDPIEAKLDKPAVEKHVEK
jgi:hypothetical protein